MIARPRRSLLECEIIRTIAYAIFFLCFQKDCQWLNAKYNQSSRSGFVENEAIMYYPELHSPYEDEDVGNGTVLPGGGISDLMPCLFAPVSLVNIPQ